MEMLSVLRDRVKQISDRSLLIVWIVNGSLFDVLINRDSFSMREPPVIVLQICVSFIIVFSMCG